jgi:hypothetical protein
MRVVLGLMVALVLVAPARAQVAADAACPADTPAAMALTGLPAVAVVGRSYEVRLDPAGPDTATGRNGSTLGVHDRSGVGWSAHYQFLGGVRQAFSVGLNGPFTVTGSYSELLAGGGTCTRTLSAALPIERRIYAVVECDRSAIEPRSGIVLACRGERLRLRAMTWRGWNGDVAVGHGRLNGRALRVVLSHPRECSTLNGFIYTRAKLPGRTRLIPIACPIAA